MSDSKDLVAHGASALPEHPPRRTDIDARAAKRAERQVAILFLIAALSVVAFMLAYGLISPDASVYIPGAGDLGALNLALGVSLGLALFCIGAGAIHWARKLMPAMEEVQDRAPLGASEDEKGRAGELFAEGVAASGWNDRPIIRRSLIAAMALLPLPILAMLRDLGPGSTAAEKSKTIWKAGERIVSIDSGTALRPEDIPLGGLVSAEPIDLAEVEEEAGNLNARSKAAIILVRMTPAEIVAEQDFPDGDPGSFEGILAYSKICTHVGCPIALYEQSTHHLLCPCHQSTFDLADQGNVVFGPAARRMPQLAISVDSEGYLVARGDFVEPVGPSFWERES
jgi:ubiquinol-cytochrome c reductase iron-sulfur subunit